MEDPRLRTSLPSSDHPPSQICVNRGSRCTAYASGPGGPLAPLAVVVLCPLDPPFLCPLSLPSPIRLPVVVKCCVVLLALCLLCGYPPLTASPIMVSRVPAGAGAVGWCRCWPLPLLLYVYRSIYVYVLLAVPAWPYKMH